MKRDILQDLRAVIGISCGKTFHVKITARRPIRGGFSLLRRRFLMLDVEISLDTLETRIYQSCSLVNVMAFYLLPEFGMV